MVATCGLVSLGPALAGSKEAIQLNNTAVTSLNKSDFDGAINALEKALSIDPTYSLARVNLAIAYNNKALGTATANPKQALAYFHYSMALNSANPTTRENINGMIKMLGKDPANPSDRLALADEANRSGDYRSAVIEYMESLTLKNDKAVGEKLRDSFNKLDRKDKDALQERFNNLHEHSKAAN